MERILNHETVIRIECFAGLFALLAMLEAIFPRRPQRIGRLRRWPGNLGIVAINSLVTRRLVPVTTVGVGLVAEAKGWGPLGLAGIGGWPAVLLGFLALDLAIYVQHIAFHKIAILWRLRRTHHADLELDATTGLRFHPIEIVLSLLIKLAVIAVIGAPVLAVLFFKVALNATSMFNHANLVLPSALDRVLRLIVVTPDMHRVHHSIRREETDSNFGFNLPWWDACSARSEPNPSMGTSESPSAFPCFAIQANFVWAACFISPSARAALRHDPNAESASSMSTSQCRGQETDAGSHL